MRTPIIRTILLSSVVLASPARAITIVAFDKMAEVDQNEYVGDLIEGVEKLLNGEGRSDLTNKVHVLFGTISAGDRIPLGVAEFEQNLAVARVADAQRTARDPKACRLEVEDAMALTLRKNGIEVPKSFFTMLSGFRAQHRPSDAIPDFQTDDPIGQGGFIGPPR